MRFLRFCLPLAFLSGCMLASEKTETLSDCTGRLDALPARPQAAAPAQVLARSRGYAGPLSGRGDSVFWRVDTLAFVWHDGRLDSLPQAWDGGFQLPGVPAYWFYGTGRTKAMYWDGKAAAELAHRTAANPEWEASGERMIWDESEAPPDSFSYATSVWYAEKGAVRSLESPYPVNFSPRLSAQRLAWMARPISKNAGVAVLLLDGAQLREIAPPLSNKRGLVLTDSLAAWIDGDSVLVYRDGSVRAVGAGVDPATRLFAGGGRLVWAISMYGGPYPVFRYAGGVLDTLYRYPPGGILKEALFNEDGILLRGTVGDTPTADWFAGGTHRSLGFVGYEEAYLSPRHAYALHRVHSIGAPGPCEDPAHGFAYLFGSYL